MSFDSFQNRSHTALCTSCATIFSSSEAAKKLVAGETVNHRCQYGSLLNSKKDGCPLCDVLLKVVSFPPMKLVDGRLVVAREDFEGDEPKKLQHGNILQFCFRMYDQRFKEMHTIELIFKSESMQDKTIYFEISADNSGSTP
jgi:hypothetical protein